MDIYGRFRSIDTFTYRGLKVEVLKAEKGRKHCKIQHEFNERKCQACGAKLTARSVYLVSVGGQRLDIDCDDIADAVELAKAFIDDQMDGDDDAPDLSDMESMFSPPKKPKERDAKSPAGTQGGRAKLVVLVRKMGWGKRALALVRGKSGPAKKEK
jgi:hypothetical protein